MDPADPQSSTARPRDGLGRRLFEAMRTMTRAGHGLGQQGLVDAVVSLLGEPEEVTHCAFYRWVPDREALRLEAHSLADPPPILRELAAGQGLLGHVARTRVAQMTRDYASDPRALPGFPQKHAGLGVPVTAPGGELLGVLGLFTQSERRFLEEDLELLQSLGLALGGALENQALAERVRASEERYRSLVESIPSVVYERAPDGALLFASAKIEALTGHPAAELLAGSPDLRELLLPEDRERLAAELARVRGPGQALAGEYRLRHRDGDIVWVSDHAVSRRAANGQLVLAGVLTDVREKKLLEAQLMEQSRLATLGEMAASVAHEVNNPLSGVLNYAQLAQRLAPDGPPRLLEALEGIVAEGQRIHEITRALLTYARRPGEESYRGLAAHELVKASLTLLRRQLREDLVTLTVEVPADLPLVKARGQELQQVLQNLLVNARHALNTRYPGRRERDEGKRLTVRACHEPDPSGPGFIRFEVEDHGTGMTAETLARAFVPFFTTRPDGTGLGLPISREIVQRHGGTIEVESEHGVRTLFTVRVPVWTG